MNTATEQAHAGQDHHGHQSDDELRTVNVHVNNQRIFLQPGPYDVPTFKKVAGVPQADDLEELVNCKLKPIADGATIHIKGCEVFISHVKDGGAPEVTNMSFPEDQAAELKLLCPDVSVVNEAGCTYLLLPGLNLPDGCSPASTDTLLCPAPVTATRPACSLRKGCSPRPSETGTRTASASSSTIGTLLVGRLALTSASHRWLQHT